MNQEIHDQYAKVISFLIEKKIKDENPDIYEQEMAVELQKRYNELVEDYFKVNR